MFQLCLQLVMLFINNTDTAVERGLSGLFKESDNKEQLLVFLQSVITPTTALILSSLWSVKTVILTSLNIVNTKKVQECQMCVVHFKYYADYLQDGAISTSGKLMLVVSSIAGYGGRFIAILAHFTPAMGLFNILGRDAK